MLKVLRWLGRNLLLSPEVGVVGLWKVEGRPLVLGMWEEQRDHPQNWLEKAGQ